MMDCVERKYFGGSRSVFPPTVNSEPFSIRLLSGEELAHELRFDGTTSSFRRFCKSAGIEPVPGRKDCYDPVVVRHRLNRIQGIGESNAPDSQGALTRSMMRRNV